MNIPLHSTHTKLQRKPTEKTALCTSLVAEAAGAKRFSGTEHSPRNNKLDEYFSKWVTATFPQRTSTGDGALMMLVPLPSASLISPGVWLQRERKIRLFIIHHIKFGASGTVAININ
jgi:hypothetical protein